MKKHLLALLGCLTISSFCQAQIISPDTVCINTAVQFSTTTPSTTYTWAFDSTVNIKQTPSPLILSASSSYMNVPAFATMNYDNGAWYSFITNYANNDVLRASYGSNPNSGSPTVTDLGKFGMSSGQTEGIEIIKDSSSGHWYGFVVSGTTLLRLSFGAWLSNTPTDTSMSISAFDWPHQLNIKRYGTKYVGFVANRNGHMTRLDFGSSLTNVPTATNLPFVGSYSNPCNFALYQESGNWYMLVTSLINNKISLLSFGSNIQNDTPSGKSYGGFGYLKLPRSVTFLKSCNQLLAYSINEDGDLIQYDFNGTIDDTPSVSKIGNISGSSIINAFTTYVYDSSQYFLYVNTGGNKLYRQKIIHYPYYDTSKYYDSTITHAFTTTGLHHVTLLCDEGFFMGAYAFCKDVYVTGTANTRLWTDTSLCEGGTLHLDAGITGASSYAWSTGATTPGITVFSSGKYWVNLTGARCYAASDTINVDFIPIPDPNLGNDTSMCDHGRMTLSAGISGSVYSYLWSNGSTTATTTAIGPGTYWVKVTDSGCSGSDTLLISTRPTPSIFIGNDTTICEGDTIILNCISEPTGTTYLWNTGSTDPYLPVSQKGAYSLTVSYNGCDATDSIYINQTHIPHINLGPDTTLCNGDILRLPLSADSGLINWYNGTTKDQFIITKAGIYSAEIVNQCGSTADTVDVKYKLCDIWFPSGFTPNGDGKNDIARALGNIDGISHFKLYIYNRWGQLIFHTSNPHEGWDGTWKGVPQEVGAYFYMIKYDFRGSHLMKGDITLIR